MQSIQLNMNYDASFLMSSNMKTSPVNLLVVFATWNLREESC